MRLRYEEHTWPELRELAKRDDLVVLIPTATLEDHGYHLPIDTDARLVTAIAERAVEASGGQALLFPTQVHGYTPHHLDFPGSVTLRWQVFVEALVDQGRSLCRHGFDRILIVNGHGSNQPLVDIAARLIGLEHRNAVCGSCFYLQSERGRQTIAEVRDSEFPGGMAHACELETSIYLALEHTGARRRRAAAQAAQRARRRAARSCRAPSRLPLPPALSEARFEPCDQVDPELYPTGEPAHEAACLLLRGDASPESRADIT
jgi:creatinine amidohydrolase